MSDKVSIIVPVYNVEAYIHRCVDSLRNQTYENIEIILVDDGSTDTSPTICDEYRKIDERVKVLHQKNQGQSVARNEGLKYAAGEYICFVDSDDYVNENYIQHLYSSLVDHNADISMCGFDYFTGETYGKNNPCAGDRFRSFDRFEMIRNMHTVKGELFVVVWGKLYKKDIVKDIKFPEGRICEDLTVLYKYYDRADKVVASNAVLYYYFRSNVNSSTYQINEKFYKDVFLALEEEEEYLYSKNYGELVQYANKTHMYWLFDYYTRIRREDKKKAQTVLKKYRSLYKKTKHMEMEKFYSVFNYLPELYLLLKGK